MEASHKFLKVTSVRGQYSELDPEFVVSEIKKTFASSLTEISDVTDQWDALNKNGEQLCQDIESMRRTITDLKQTKRDILILVREMIEEVGPDAVAQYLSDFVGWGMAPFVTEYEYRASVTFDVRGTVEAPSHLTDGEVEELLANALETDAYFSSDSWSDGDGVSIRWESDGVTDVSIDSLDS
jgi:hypothetical protein